VLVPRGDVSEIADDARLERSFTLDRRHLIELGGGDDVRDGRLLGV
jgi:hypothetical protein